MLPRREFLYVTGQAALGASLFRTRVYAQKDQREWPRMIAALEEQLPGMLEEAAVPGASIAIIRDAKLYWRRGFGVRDSAARQQVDQDTVFAAASMSKPVFAYLVLKLCERGVLELDTPLTRYTPERYLDGDPRLDRITARHLLSHTGGFQNWRSGNEPLRIHFTPGEQFLYSGEGYSYLQAVVTRLIGRVNPNDCATYEAGVKVCGSDFDAYMKSNLLAPFGMKASGYVWNRSLERRAARPHDSKGQPILKARPGAPDVARYGAAGALWTTPGDYARFMIQILTARKADAFHLSPQGVQDMIRPQIKVTDTPLPVSWALGWRILHTTEGDLVCHDGGDAGFRTFGAFSFPGKSGFVMMINGDNGGTVINKLLSGGHLRPAGIALPQLSAAR